MLLENWEAHEEKAKVTTVRMYPSTLAAIREYKKSKGYEVVPEYVVMDEIIKRGMEVENNEKKITKDK